jgi:peptidoglycan/LPS O-acetylase OafA/YrhL
VNPYARTIKYLPGKVFSKLGERSYGLYLWHGIVIVILSKVVGLEKLLYPLNLLGKALKM